MASPLRTTVGRRLGVLVAGTLALTALTVATAEASAPSGANSRPRTPIPAFLKDGDRYLKFDHPDAVGETAAGSVNDRGQIVGRYTNTPSVQDPTATNRGYLLDRGRLTRLDPPGAVSSQAVGINNRGQVVGEYRDAAGTYHGYLWERGRFTTIDRPGAAATSLRAINDRGQILGAYADDLSMRPDTFHGFVLDRGRVRTFDAPAGTLMLPSDLNSRGQIAGSTLTDVATLAGARGFLLAKGAGGPFTPIDVPGAPRNLVFGLNDRGQLVGAYENTAAAAPGPAPAGAAAMGGLAQGSGREPTGNGLARSRSSML
jgi:probable HAF family extracellular repeat protein